MRMVREGGNRRCHGNKKHRQTDGKTCATEREDEDNDREQDRQLKEKHTNGRKRKGRDGVVRKRFGS